MASETCKGRRCASKFVAPSVQIGDQLWDLSAAFAVNSLCIQRSRCSNVIGMHVAGKYSGHTSPSVVIQQGSGDGSNRGRSSGVGGGRFAGGGCSPPAETSQQTHIT